MDRSGCPSPSEEELGNIRTEARATPSSRLSSRPGSALGVVLERLESLIAGQSENARSMHNLQAEVGQRLGTLSDSQDETSRSLHNLQDRLERIESPAPQFAVGSDSNPSHRLEVTSSRPEDSLTTLALT